MTERESLYGVPVALWVAGSDGKRVGKIHRVRQTLDMGEVITWCGLFRGIWNQNLTTLNTLAVPCTKETEVTCARCAPM